MSTVSRAEAKLARQEQAAHHLSILALSYQLNDGLFDDDAASGALLGAALACISNEECRWWSANILPFEGLFNIVDSYSCELAEDCDSPEDALMFLLFVREVLRNP